jgi:hypothetical protein
VVLLNGSTPVTGRIDRSDFMRGALESLNETSPPDRRPDSSSPARAGATGSTGDARSFTSTTTAASDAADGSSRDGPKDGQGNVGDALRSIYQQTIEENVPDEMLDLLGRLD